MAAPSRETGIDLIGDAPWGTHFCQFYQTGQDLLDVIVPYLREGLLNNEFCVWVTSDPLSVEVATDALRNAVPYFDEYLKKQQIEIFPYTEWYMKDGYFDFHRVLDGWIEKYDKAVARGFDGMRVTGNTAWLESKDWSKFTEYEDAINQVIGDYRMLVLCTYSLDKCDSSEIIDVVSNHEFALIKRAGEWELIESAEHRRAEQQLMHAVQEASNRSAETETLLSAARAVMKHKKFDDAARAIFDFCKELIGADSGYIALTKGEEYDVLFLDAGGRPCTVDKNLPMPIRGLRAESFRTRYTAYQNDFQNSKYMDVMPPGHVNLDNALFAPLLLDGEPVGLLGLSNKPGGFNENDARLAAAFGELVSIALLNARAYEEVDRKREEAETLAEVLQGERDRRDILMENSPAANLVLLDWDFNFIMVNTAYADSCRLRKEDLIGKNHFELYPHEENEAIFKQVRSTGKAVEYKEKPFEFPEMPERGITFWDWTLTPVKNPSGEVQALVFSLIDVTEKVKSRQLNEALNNINTIINSSLDFDEIMRDVMDASSVAMEAESVVLATRQKVDQAVFMYTRGEAGFTEIGSPLEYKVAPVADDAFKTGQTIAVSDALNSSRFDPSVMQKLGIRSSIASPFLVKGDVVGVIAFRYHSRMIEFNEAHINFVEKLAVSISMAIENAQLYQQEQQDKVRIQSYADRLSVLHQIGLTLNRESDKRKLLKTILSGAAELTFAGTGAIILVDKGKTDLVSMYYAPWYTERCRVLAEASSLHKRIDQMVAKSAKDAVRIEFGGLAEPLRLPDGHTALDGLLIGTIRDTLGRRRGYFMLSSKAGGARFTEEDEEMIALLAAQSSVALTSAEHFENEHEVASTLQSSLLPDIPVRDDLDIGLVYRSVSEFAKLGGDFYDFIELGDGRLSVLVGDVCGKGLEAATATAMIKYTVRAYMGDGMKAGECLTRLNRNVAQQLPMEKFVTLGLAVLDLKKGTVGYSSAGHPMPLFCVHDRPIDVSVSQAVPLGVLPDYDFSTAQVPIESGCSILMYTDGLIEARPVDGEPFGEKRTAKTFSRLHQLPAQRAAEKLMEAAAQYSAGHLRDDMALVLMKVR